MEGERYPVLLWTHTFFRMDIDPARALSSLFCKTGFWTTVNLEGLCPCCTRWLSCLSQTTLLEIQKITKRKHKRGPKGPKRNGLIPPRMPNRWEQISTPGYQTEWVVNKLSVRRARCRPGADSPRWQRPRMLQAAEYHTQSKAGGAQWCPMQSASQQNLQENCQNKQKPPKWDRTRLLIQDLL